MIGLIFGKIYKLLGKFGKNWARWDPIWDPRDIIGKKIWDLSLWVMTKGIYTWRLIRDFGGAYAS